MYNIGPIKIQRILWKPTQSDGKSLTGGRTFKRMKLRMWIRLMYFLYIKNARGIKYKGQKEGIKQLGL
jgi:hypothetical protein